MYDHIYMYIIIIALSQKRAIYAPSHLIFSIDIVAFACYLSVRRCKEVLLSCWERFALFAYTEKSVSAQTEDVNCSTYRCTFFEMLDTGQCY